MSSQAVPNSSCAGCRKRKVKCVHPGKDINAPCSQCVKRREQCTPVFPKASAPRMAKSPGDAQLAITKKKRARAPQANLSQPDKVLVGVGVQTDAPEVSPATMGIAHEPGDGYEEGLLGSDMQMMIPFMDLPLSFVNMPEIYLSQVPNPTMSYPSAENGSSEQVAYDPSLFDVASWLQQTNSAQVLNGYGPGTEYGSNVGASGAGQR